MENREMKGKKMERRGMEGREMKGRKLERREMEKGGALTGGQAACFAPFPFNASGGQKPF